MLLNLHKKNWTHGLTLKNYDEHTEENEQMMKVNIKNKIDIFFNML